MFVKSRVKTLVVLVAGLAGAGSGGLALRTLAGGGEARPERFDNEKGRVIYRRESEGGR